MHYICVTIWLDPSVAFVESSSLGKPTIRHSQCELLCTHDVSRCSRCEAYRSCLFAMMRRSDQDTTDHSSHGNYRYLTYAQLVTRLHNLHGAFRRTTSQLQSLKKKISMYCSGDQQKGIVVPECAECRC